MSLPRFIQIHTLHTYPAALLNRDDAGLAKRLPYGGAVRTRISSQCLKRHWRVADDAFAHSWFTLLGDIGDDGHGTMTIFRTLGGAFDRGRTDNSRALGTVEITLDGCSGMRLDYAFSPGLHAYAEREGTIELVRLGNCPSE